MARTRLTAGDRPDEVRADARSRRNVPGLRPGYVERTKKRGDDSIVAASMNPDAM